MIMGPVKGKGSSQKWNFREPGRAPREPECETREEDPGRSGRHTPKGLRSRLWRFKNIDIPSSCSKKRRFRLRRFQASKIYHSNVQKGRRFRLRRLILFRQSKRVPTTQAPLDFRGPLGLASARALLWPFSPLL